jgi:hypothetical protein
MKAQVMGVRDLLEQQQQPLSLELPTRCPRPKKKTLEIKALKLVKLRMEMFRQ